MIKTANPYFKNKKKILNAIRKILKSGRLMEGEYSSSFEQKFAQYIGTKYAVALNSCTSALEIVLRYINVKGAEVIVPANTFIATPNAVVYAGAKPVFADIESDTFCLDPADLQRRITPKTKAVIVVHIAGLISPRISEIIKICKAKKLVLIEDCAHAHGSIYKGKKAGSFGLAGCFSFYPTKIMTTGSGGMLTTNNKSLDAFARSLRLHGKGKSLSEIINFGNDWFLDEFRSAIGLFQLEELENMLKTRRRIAKAYLKLLRNQKNLQIYNVPKYCRHAYYKFPVLVDSSINVKRLRGIIQHKYDFELEAVYNPPCHLQPIYKGHGRFPVAEDVLSRQISLPIHPLLTDKQVNYVVGALTRILEKL